MARLRTHRDVILALGGPSALARSLGIYKAQSATGHWPTRGIPSRYWNQVAELAAAAAITLTARDLEKMAPGGVGYLRRAA